MEDAAPESGPTVTASAVVETNTGPVTTVSGIVKRPTSLSSAFGNNTAAGGSGAGSPVTSPTSGQGITATLRPVSAPFLPHQSPSPTPPTAAATEASNERLSSATTAAAKNEEATLNDDRGRRSGW